MRKLIPLFLLTLLLIISRVLAVHDISAMANLQPLGALLFCCMAFHRSRWLWVPAFAWFGTYAYTNAVQGYAWNSALLVVVLGLLAIVLVGKCFRGKSKPAILGGSVLAASAFYLLTNSLSWLMSAGYAKTPEGFLQAIWIGLPGFPPTWMFFRNSLVSMVLFTSLYLIANFQFAPRKVRTPSLQAHR